MFYKYASSFALAMLLSINMHAEHEHHHGRHEEKIKIEIEPTHCHQKERSLSGKIVAGSVQLVENNAYLLSAAGSGIYLFATLNHGIRDKDIPKVLGIAVASWIGLGLATRNVLRAVMSQCNIPKL